MCFDEMLRDGLEGAVWLGGRGRSLPFIDAKRRFRTKIEIAFSVSTISFSLANNGSCEYSLGVSRYVEQYHHV
jgi:hypothetical protein